MMAGDRDLPLLPPLSDGLYAVEKTYTKPYAACRYCHPAIDAALRIRGDYQFDPEDILSVQVFTYRLAVYQHDHTDIPGPASAKMSIPYSVAAALCHGRAGMESYSERAVGDPRVLALTRKVQVKDDQAMTDAFPKETRARVKLTLLDGQSLEREVKEPKGEPSTPLTKEEFLARFLDLMAFGGRDESQARTLYRSVQEGEGSMEDFFSLLKEGSKE
jgi:2-methylcitrate dehydratase PrpD